MHLELVVTVVEMLEGGQNCTACQLSEVKAGYDGVTMLHERIFLVDSVQLVGYLVGHLEGYKFLML